MRNRAPLTWIAILAAAAVAAAGCGRKAATGGGASPAACVQGFDQALRAGDVAGAARFFAYGRIAEENNSDWGSFTSAQRDLIVGKMREQQVEQLTNWKAGYTSASYEVTGLAQQGEWATLNLVGGGRSVPVKLFSRDGQWLIHTIGDLPAPTPGS